MRVQEVALWTDEDFIQMESGGFQGYKQVVVWCLHIVLGYQITG